MKKAIRVFFRIILLVLVLSVTLTSCTLRVKSARYEKGDFSRGFLSNPLFFMSVKSDKNVFDVKDVSFTLMYAFELMDGWSELSAGGGSSYVAYGGSGGAVTRFSSGPSFFVPGGDGTVIGIYAVKEYRFFEEVYPSSGEGRVVLDDYKNIESHYLLNELSGKEAISEEYTYDIDRLWMFDLGGVQHNHEETVTVPEEVFSAASGGFGIAILTFSECDNGGYCLLFKRYVHLNYTKLGEGLVKLNF